MPLFNANGYNDFSIERVFAFDPPKIIDLTQVGSAPDNWLEQLEQLACEYKPDLKTPFEVHVGPDSNYAVKKELLVQLKIIYHRLVGDLDDKLGPLTPNARAALFDGLLTDVELCTPGFHNRVIVVLQKMRSPMSLSQLLYSVRESLVMQVATSLTSDVHGLNDVTREAQLLGINVSVNLESDPFTVSTAKLSHTIIKHALKKQFEMQYTPCGLPHLLAMEVRRLLSQEGYDGIKLNKDSYSVAEAAAIAAEIEKYLPRGAGQSNDLAYLDYFVVETDEEERSYIRDVNWQYVATLFYHKLINEHYLLRAPTPHSLLDWVAFLRLTKDVDAVCNDVELQASFRSEFLSTPLSDFFQTLKLVQTDFPDVYKVMVKRIDLKVELRTRIESIWNRLHSAAGSEVGKELGKELGVLTEVLALLDEGRGNHQYVRKLATVMARVDTFLLGELVNQAPTALLRFVVLCVNAKVDIHRIQLFLVALMRSVNDLQSISATVSSETLLLLFNYLGEDHQKQLIPDSHSFLMMLDVFDVTYQWHFMNALGMDYVKSLMLTQTDLLMFFLRLPKMERMRLTKLIGSGFIERQHAHFSQLNMLLSLLNDTDHLELMETFLSTSYLRATINDGDVLKGCLAKLDSQSRVVLMSRLGVSHLKRLHLTEEQHAWLRENCPELQTQLQSLTEMDMKKQDNEGLAQGNQSAARGGRSFFVFTAPPPPDKQQNNAVNSKPHFRRKQ